MIGLIVDIVTAVILGLITAVGFQFYGLEFTFIDVLFYGSIEYIILWMILIVFNVLKSIYKT